LPKIVFFSASTCICKICAWLTITYYKYNSWPIYLSLHQNFNNSGLVILASSCFTKYFQESNGLKLWIPEHSSQR
jgi:hypothetical protein